MELEYDRFLLRIRLIFRCELLVLERVSLANQLLKSNQAPSQKGLKDDVATGFWCQIRFVEGNRSIMPT